MLGALVVGLGCAVGACVAGAGATRVADAPRRAGPEHDPVYAIEAVGPERWTVSFGDRHAITFAREASPVAVDLRAVGFDERRAFAVGDRGTILERGPRGGWRAVGSGCGERLRAIDRVFANERVLVVGDHGTILVRGKDAAWRREPSPTDRDLLAVRDGFIAGAHGTLLANVDGHWRIVPTHVEEDLHALWKCSFNERRDGRTENHTAICAAGNGGRLLRCTVEKLAVDCATQPSPTSNDLLAASDWPLVFGADGTVLKGMSYDPFRYEAMIGLVGITVYATAQNHWAVQLDGGGLADAALAVGSAGAVVRWARDGTVARAVTLAPRAELFGVATEELDWFIVGSGGAIFHGVTEHAQIVPTTLL